MRQCVNVKRRYSSPAQRKTEDQGSRIWWSFENALDSENEVPSAPTQQPKSSTTMY